MVGRRVTEQAVGGAVQALAAAAGLVRHVAWYVKYQMDGSARADPTPETARPGPGSDRG